MSMLARRNSHERSWPTVARRSEFEDRTVTAFMNTLAISIGTAELFSPRTVGERISTNVGLCTGQQIPIAFVSFSVAYASLVSYLNAVHSSQHPEERVVYRATLRMRQIISVQVDGFRIVVCFADNASERVRTENRTSE